MFLSVNIKNSFFCTKNADLKKIWSQNFSALGHDFLCRLVKVFVGTLSFSL